MFFLYSRQRSKEEFYVCFQDGIPQNVVELTFKAGFGLKCWGSISNGIFLQKINFFVIKMTENWDLSFIHQQPFYGQCLHDCVIILWSMFTWLGGHSQVTSFVWIVRDANNSQKSVHLNICTIQNFFRKRLSVKLFQFAFHSNGEWHLLSLLNPSVDCYALRFF